MRKQPRDRGAAAVEFALVVPVLLLLVLGIAEFGRAYSIQTTLSGAARDGVRVMALRNDPAAALETTIASATPVELGAENITITPAACVATATAPTITATVTVTYEMDFITGLLGAADLTLTGKGTMRCNG